MTDTTTARRALLALLLDRVERGALLPAEAPLLRPLVLAEQGAADRAANYENRITWETNCGEHARLLDACRNAEERAEQAEDLLRIAHETSNRSEAERAQAVQQAVRAGAAITRMRAMADRLDTGHTGLLTSWGVAAAIREALTGSPSPTPDDAPVPQCRAEYHGPGMPSGRCRLAEGHEGSHRDAMIGPDGLSWSENAAVYPTDDAPATPDGEELPRDDGRPTCRRMPTRTCPDSFNGPCGDRPCARFESDDPAPWIPDGTPTAVVDALRAGQTIVRCSPLVNPDCPGHIAPPYCDPTPSSPITPAAVPSWADDEHWPRDHDGPTTEWEQCRARYTADPSIPTGQVDVSVWSPINIRCDREAGHDGPHRESDAPDAITWEDSVAVYSSADAPSSPPSTTVTDWATRLDEMCPAHYQSDEPRLTKPAQPVDYRCERRAHGADSDHAARLAQGSGVVVFSWADAIAVYPVADAPSVTDGLLPGVSIVQRGEAGWVWECHRCGVWSGEHYTSEDIAREYATTKHVAHASETADAPSDQQ